VTWQRFASREDGLSRTVGITTGDETRITAEIEHLDGAFYIAVDPKRSNPNAYQAMLDRLDRGIESGSEMVFTIEGEVGFRLDDAEASDLRDAYLAAFALLGYRYILWPDLDVIRDRVAALDPEPKLVKRTDLFADSFRGVVTMSQPVECVCVVTDGGRCVFLPWPTKGSELNDWLAAGSPTTKSVAGRVHEWPRQMPMLLDLPGAPAA
jgi:hypothetical protein